MSRRQKIEAGRIWQVYRDSDPDTVLHEGSRASCQRFARQFGRAAKQGEIRIGKLIWEAA